jgi:hypothetical protein
MSRVSITLVRDTGVHANIGYVVIDSSSCARWSTEELFSSWKLVSIQLIEEVQVVSIFV